MDPDVARSHRATNAFHTLLLLGAIGLVFLLLGYFIAGPFGAAAACASGLFLTWFSPRVAPSFIMRLYRARRLQPGELPALSEIIALLARRAALPVVPNLYYMPTRVMNAFTVGERKHSAIGVTDGLLRALNKRELLGVLAHEVSHVRNNDMRVMTLADMVSRTASTFQTIALFGLIYKSLGGASVSWAIILVLLSVPWILQLLQLALSRTREFDADLGAVELTGDAFGLASALQKMERYQKSFFDRLLPGQRVPDPSLLRSHPNTDERVQRLRDIARAPDVEPVPQGVGFVVPEQIRPVQRDPRWHASGLWF